jgi:lysozyme family protein
VALLFGDNMASFDLAIPTILKHEGGLVNHPNDPGGITNFGISLRALLEKNDRQFDINKDGKLDAEDIKKMTLKAAIEFYRKYYWHPLFDQITSQEVATKYFDMAVNMGQRQATIIVQRALNNFTLVRTDGILGPITLANINSRERLLPFIQLEHGRFYVNLVNGNRKFQPFLLGWLNRALY